MKTTCNNCLEEFNIEPADIASVRIDDLAIQYFPCPSCGSRYVVLAANDEMQKLIVERSEIQKKIRMARAGKVREKTIRQLMERQGKIIRAQKKLHDELKPRAERLLAKEAGHGEV